MRKQNDYLLALQHSICRFIEDYCALNGFSPTIREIGGAVGMTSTSNVAYHLYELKDAGIVTFVPGKSRTYRVVGTLASPVHMTSATPDARYRPKTKATQCRKCGAPRSSVPYMRHRALCEDCFRRDAAARVSESYHRRKAARVSKAGKRRGPSGVKETV